MRPAVMPGHIEACPRMYLSVSFNRRIIDGTPAAMFLQKRQARLERLNDLPFKLLPCARQTPGG
jgi:pyruvate/2-oxoglutarate dehydrogenase complex dihydrolipoamide acyltransferase (E2) component